MQILQVQADTLAWSPDGKRLATATRYTPTTFQVWETASGKQLSTFDDQSGVDCCLEWSPDGTRLASAGVYTGGDALRIWDAATGKTVISLLGDTPGKASSVLTFTWLADGTRIVALIQTGPVGTVSNPNPPLKEEVQTWDATTGKLLSTYSASIPKFNVAAWSPDGKEIAVGNKDGSIQIWDVASGKLLLTYPGHNIPPLAIAWSPTGKAIASASGEPEVQVWDPTTGKLFFRYLGHMGNVATLAWSPDGMRIVSGSQQAGGVVEDHPIQVWDAFTGAHVFYYDGQSESIAALAWSPDGTKIASAGSATVQVWQAPPES